MASKFVTRQHLQRAIEAAEKELSHKPEAERIQRALELANEYLGGHGIESIWQGNDKPSCQYVNTGDTYNNTVIHDDVDGWRVGSWGDWLEEQEENGHAYN